MDEADQAQAVIEGRLAEALSAWRRRQPSGESLSHCVDCGGEIPEARRRAQPGATRCLACQHEHEQGRG